MAFSSFSVLHPCALLFLVPEFTTTPKVYALLCPTYPLFNCLPGWAGMLMEAVSGTWFKRLLGAPTRAASSDRGSGPVRVMVLWVKRASSSLCPSASPGNLSLIVSEGQARPCDWSSPAQLNFYCQLSFWLWAPINFIFCARFYHCYYII